MKKKLAMLTFMILLYSLVGCSKSKSSSEGTDGVNTFQGIVLDITDTTVMIEPLEDEEIRKSADQIVIDRQALEDIDVTQGDIVEIYYVGGVEETYPAKVKVLEWSIVEKKKQEEPSETKMELQSNETISNEIKGPITEEEYETFLKTADASEIEGKYIFRDFSETMNANLIGTWYDEELGEAIRLEEQGAYVYIPYLDMTGDTMYEWELLDRSERGLCPELIIYFKGKDNPGLAYYIAGVEKEYFWCNVQDAIFYRQ